ncbi:uncharacterized protein BO95DRAFT_7277 [Aspergillus brunneoviolaceus CBS 621.78]|uniref:Uncharacterized protein n=1 Tax=Aspergillus brunneoviolaceus CBS 621.78 TaxID=1450534 RepID=A0ACD1GR27_9EURO|nr:hypothetical protein BO95DRAFT_7277 [Aspergillus brunneoviolaceus CBS 621.78]RAH51592.1 hypothetical protein BO95DRAFT_7277 [Aspergillus brunneoviolaceus CBS 621.78]
MILLRVATGAINTTDLLSTHTRGPGHIITLHSGTVAMCSSLEQCTVYHSALLTLLESIIDSSCGTLSNRCYAPAIRHQQSVAPAVRFRPFAPNGMRVKYMVVPRGCSGAATLIGIGGGEVGGGKLSGRKLFLSLLLLSRFHPIHVYSATKKKKGKKRQRQKGKLTIHPILRCKCALCNGAME